MNEYLSPATIRFCLDNLNEVRKHLTRAHGEASASVKYDVDQAMICAGFVQTALKAIPEGRTE